jgi:hypothetical protein
MVPFKLIVIDSFHFFTSNLIQIASLCLPFLLFGSIVSNLLLTHPELIPAEAARFIAIALNLALRPVYTGALILLMARKARLERPKNGELLTAAMSIYLPLLTVDVICLAIFWAGIFCLIIPGIWAAVRLAFADFYLVLEKLDPKTAILKSYQGTRNYFILILSSLIIFALPLLLLVIGIGQLLEGANAGNPALLFADTIITFLSLFLEVVLFRIFMQTVGTQPKTA